MISYSSIEQALLLPVFSHHFMFLSNSLTFILAKVHARREFTDEYVASFDQSAYFKKITTRKSDGSLRWIYVPKTDEHAGIYKALYEGLKSYQDKLHDAAHGFRVGYSNVTNAAQHLSAKHLFNIDIENFYAQIDTSDVRGVLKYLGANDEVAEYLSRLCTIDGVLPQGFNTSPDIANHYLRTLDVELAAYSDSHNITYTRYVDDMSFSSSDTMNASEICEIVESFGLPLVDAKRKYQKRGANQYVTGLTIFDSARPRISKKYKRRLRLELYIIKKVGIYDFIIRLNELPEVPQDEEGLREWRHVLNEWADKKLVQVRGRVDYINAVEPDMAKKMYPILNKIIEDRRMQDDVMNANHEVARVASEDDYLPIDSSSSLN